MDFIMANLLWFIVGAVVVVLTIMGYLVEKTGLGRKPKGNKSESDINADEITQIGKPRKEKIEKEKLIKEKKNEKEEETILETPVVESSIEEQQPVVEQVVAAIPVQEVVSAELLENPETLSQSTVATVENNALLEEIQPIVPETSSIQEISNIIEPTIGTPIGTDNINPIIGAVVEQSTMNSAIETAAEIIPSKQVEDIEVEQPIIIPETENIGSLTSVPVEVSNDLSIVHTSTTYNTAENNGLVGGMVPEIEMPSLDTLIEPVVNNSLVNTEDDDIWKF